jgi:hypothetical protein
MIEQSIILDYTLLMGAIMITVGTILASVLAFEVIKDVFKK